MDVILDNKLIPGLRTSGSGAMVFSKYPARVCKFPSVISMVHVTNAGKRQDINYNTILNSL